MKTLMTLPGTVPGAFTVILDFVGGVLPAADHRLKLAMRTNRNGFFAASTRTPQN
jgi:hypothetical protein